MRKLATKDIQIVLAYLLLFAVLLCMSVYMYMNRDKYAGMSDAPMILTEDDKRAIETIFSASTSTVSVDEKQRIEKMFMPGYNK
jgi:hypothetical protein